jgi:hypothetical protein
MTMLAGTMTKLTESEMPALDALTERSADPAPWISDGEKYVLIGLSMKITDRIATGELPPHFFVLADTKFNDADTLGLGFDDFAFLVSKLEYSDRENNLMYLGVPQQGPVEVEKTSLFDKLLGAVCDASAQH